MSTEHRQALLTRLRYERSLGLETVARVALERQAVVALEPAVATAAAPRAIARPAQPQVVAPPATLALPPIDAADAQARWKALESRALACTACVLHKGRTQVVFGTGNRLSPLVFVGEAPGYDEDQQGVPFVGKAGQLLNKIIGAMGLQREEIYICNAIKCRPPENRTPLPDELATCNPYLVEQLELIRPKVIVALGSPAAKTLLKTNQGIMSLRGKWFSYRGIAVMPTYHPAFLLRSYTDENRRAVWEDMKKVVERLKA